MNRVYHVVWNRSKGVWQAASELSQSSRSSANGAGSVAGALKTISAGALLLIALPLHASNLPSGGTVVGGQGNINSSDKTLTVNQSSQNMAIDWQDFSIAEGHTVNFHQPSAQAAALNRVTGNNVSEIRGALNANGRVFLVNPNGVMFSPTVRVDVGALVTSTLDISTEDFMAGNYHFEGASANAIVNQGNITTAEGGVVAMIAAEIINTGSITTPQGSTLMGAGSKVTLDLGGPVKIEVEEALLDTYIEQGGAIRADGGLVYLTAKAAGELTSSVINHTGVTEARTLATGEDGQIMLMGDMDSGRVEVAGTLDASAPNGGDGGFIETSAANVSILDEATVTTKAVSGETGEWLIDPTDIEIVAGSGGDFSDNTSGSSSIGVDTLVSNLANNNITVQTPTDGSEDGNITVSADIVWDTDTRLTLDAINEIYVNATIENTNTTGGGVYFDTTPTGSQMMGDLTDHVVFSNEGKVVIHNIDQLQWVSRALAGTYELGSDIDASSTSIWNDGKGFDPIKRTVMVEDEMGGMPGMEMEEILGFSGRFDGRGHIIDALTINRPEENYVGLFGQSRSNSSSPEIKNVTLTNVSVTGKDRTGGLVGQGNQTTIANVSVTGVVEGNDYAGGLAGELRTASLTTSYSNASVVGKDRIGGLTGYIYSTNIENSYAIDSVSGTNRVGGLVGMISHGGIINSYASNSVIASGAGADVGGLVGNINAGSPDISQSYYNNQANTGTMADSGDYGKTKSEIIASANNDWDNSIWATSISGADYAGYAIDTIDLPVLEALYTPTETLFEGGMGVEGDAYTIIDWNQLQNINYNSDVLTGGYHFALSNNLGMSTTGYDALASSTANGGAGWNPIGGGSNDFNGTFDGQSHTITGLTIKSGSSTGLFGRIGASGVVRNIGLLGGSVKGQYAGMLAGMNYGSITNAYATGTVTGSNNSYSGGLVGFNQGGGSITNSYATGDVSGTQSGGLVGFNLGSGSIATAYATGDVNGIDEAGGLVGFNSGSIINAYATGAVMGNNNAGGLAGFSSGSITNAYASGAASGSTSSGGLVGFSPGGNVNSSYYATTDADGNAIDENYDSNTGEGKSVAELQTASTFTGWDLSTSGGSGVWRLYEGQTSPLLRSFMTVATVSGNSEPTSRVYDASTQINNDLLDLHWVTADESSFNSNLLQGNGFSLDSKNVGNRNLTHDLYSGQTGYDIVIDPSLTNKQVEVTSFALSLDGLSAADKTYDGSKSATLIGLGMINAFSGDSVTLSGNATGNFVDKNAGIDKAVTLAGVTLGGADAANYSLSLPTDWIASINKKAITVSGITAADKVYDATTDATVDITNAEGWISGDNVQVSATGAFAHRNAGSDKIVNLASSYSGADVDNYTITDQESTTADITRRAINVSGITAEDRVYDGTTDVTVNSSNASGWISGDEVQVDASGAFADRNAGSDKTVNLASSYSGADVDNYTITDQESTTADITRRAITVSGTTVADKVYDGTDVANVTAGSLGNLVVGETLALTANGQFDSANAGKREATVNYTLEDGDNGLADNYALTTTGTTTTASIALRPVTVMADGQSKDIGDADPVLTYQAGCGVLTADCGLVGGESLSGELERESSEDAGSYSIEQGTVTNTSNPNYVIEFRPNTLVINPLETGGDTGTGESAGSGNTNSRNEASRVIAALQQSNPRMTSGSRPGADVGTNAFSSMPSQEDRQLSGGLELVEIDGARLAAQSSSRDQSGLLPVFVVDGGMQFNDTQNSDEQ